MFFSILKREKGPRHLLPAAAEGFVLSHVFLPDTSPVAAGTDIIANAPPSSFPGQRGRVAVPIRSDAGSLFQIFLSVFRDKSIYTFGLVRVAGKIVTGIRKNKKFMFYAVLSKQRVELL